MVITHEKKRSRNEKTTVKKKDVDFCKGRKDPKKNFLAGGGGGKQVKKSFKTGKKRPRSPCKGATLWKGGMVVASQKWGKKETPLRGGGNLPVLRLLKHWGRKKEFPKVLWKGVEGEKGACLT